MTFIRPTLGALALIAATLASGVANAAPTTFYSTANVLAGNSDGSGDWVVGAANTSIKDSLSNTSGSVTYSGTNVGGSAAAMTFSYAARSISGSGGLKAQASANVSTPFDDRSPVVGLDLTPNYFFTVATAEMNDTLTVQSDIPLSYVTVSIRFHGDALKSTSDERVLSYGTLSGWNGALANSTEGANDFTVNSGRLAVTNGTFDLYLHLRAALYIDITQKEGDVLNDFYIGNADFFNTATIERISGFDAAGKPLDVATVTGTDGFSYQTVRVVDPTNPGNEVPEPGSLALIGIGVASIAAIRRRTRR
ncbi:PEP-CTERM sorting domain-containing protein [Pseudorhodoferax sp. Leaf274]|uniref:PEP-CTERM sorting domain-containing protein n=1 Tax=Pseudorhodoferax sp. Leaf274 TaxID=1736318 RepID=UPI0009E95F04|nr:PEP-CTERM sorting domain-containing protein [Pseudorhodoferax sp. Leaf274]